MNISESLDRIEACIFDIRDAEKELIQANKGGITNFHKVAKPMKDAIRKEEERLANIVTEICEANIGIKKKLKAIFLSYKDKRESLHSGYYINDVTNLFKYVFGIVFSTVRGIYLTKAFRKYKTMLTIEALNEDAFLSKIEKPIISEEPTCEEPTCEEPTCEEPTCEDFKTIKLD